MTGKKQNQKYQNIYAFHHNKSSKKTKKILSFPITGLCNKCTKIIEWKKQYRKYKPLTVPRKCCKCDQKSVRDAYHLCCHPCAEQQLICAKCLVLLEEANEQDLNVEEDELEECDESE